MSRIGAKVQQVIARAGVELIRNSHIADGYWRRWRGDFFDYAQSRGLHILPVHYYTPVPDTRTLRDSDEAIFAQHIDYRCEQAMQELRQYAEQFQEKFAEIGSRNEADKRQFSFQGSPYHPLEAEVLYSTIRSSKPKKIIEIGCGYSTLLIAEALRDAKHDDPTFGCEYICYEPFRPSYLDPAPEQVTRFVDKPVQELDCRTIAELGPGDLLFIDSTHVAAIQSDVVHEYLALLPALNPGVRIHIHDIFLPYDYPMNWMHKSRFFWNEQYLLFAYLLGNNGIRVTMPLHYLWRQHEAELRERFPSTEKAHMPPSAMWLQTC
ncbi:MAG: class I SAM-dependent methyltransferase [Phycisphaerales bacterium JB052]